MKKIVCFLFTISAILMLPFVCSAKDVTSEEATRLIKADKDIVIIDLRTPEEFTVGHLANAVNINFNDSAFKTTLNKLDRDGKYIIYCRSGVRSRSTNNVMHEMNFKNIYHLSGGFMDWSSKGLPTIK